MNKQKIINYIEELERKAQDGERYFELWHEEYHKNKQAIEYIENLPVMFYPDDFYEDNHKEIEWNREPLLDILKGVDKE